MPLTTIVTGASRGLGIEFVRQLTARGDTVIATVRSAKDEEPLRKLGATVMRLDVTDPASIESFAAALQGRPVDVLINNAGVMMQDNNLAALSMDAFEKVFRANTFGPALLTRAVMPNLRAGGRKLIANISSTLGSIGSATGGFAWSYCASKSALNMLTVLAAKELQKESFISVTFCPGWNKTDMGGANAPLDPANSIRSLIAVMDRLTPADNGRYISHEGKTIPW